jgi:hypothetical protein
VEEVREAIIRKVLITRPEIEEDALLDQTVEGVIDRFLVYTGRHRLEEDQVPEVMYTTLADVVVSTYKTVEAQAEGANAVSKVKDHGQEITFSDRLKSYLGQEDSKIFLEAKGLMDKFRIARVVENT